jgi:hypothetical protein
MMRRIHMGCDDRDSCCLVGADVLPGYGIELTSEAPGGTREAWSLGLAEESIS